jgi:hypothetical protein
MGGLGDGGGTLRALRGGSPGRGAGAGGGDSTIVESRSLLVSGLVASTGAC